MQRELARECETEGLSCFLQPLRLVPRHLPLHRGGSLKCGQTYKKPSPVGEGGRRFEVLTYKKAPSGRELARERETEGECVYKEICANFKVAQAPSATSWSPNLAFARDFRSEGGSFTQPVDKENAPSSRLVRGRACCLYQILCFWHVVVVNGGAKERIIREINLNRLPNI